MKTTKTVIKKKITMGLLNRPHKKAVFNITTKLRLRDAIKWQPENKTIDYLIKHEPVKLWNRIYNIKSTENRISLVEPAYKKLKERIRKLEPSLIEDLKCKKKHKNDLRNLKRILKNGKSPFKVGGLKKIASIKVIK
jgi:hypothetical protein